MRGSTLSSSSSSSRGVVVFVVVVAVVVWCRRLSTRWLGSALVGAACVRALGRRGYSYRNVNLVEPLFIECRKIHRNLAKRGEGQWPPFSLFLSVRPFLSLDFLYVGGVNA